MAKTQRAATTIHNAFTGSPRDQARIAMEIAPIIAIAPHAITRSVLKGVSRVATAVLMGLKDEKEIMIILAAWRKRTEAVFLDELNFDGANIAGLYSES
jgi:hypothetical protein